MITGSGWRRAGAIAGILSTSCQPLPHPFANDVPKPGSPMLALRDTATVSIAPLAGGPSATAEKLAPAMAEALRQRDIAASDRAMGIASYQLDGRLQAMPRSGGKAAIVALWELRDPMGKSLGSRAERIEAAADDWQQGKTEAVALLAAKSADQIAAMLQDQAPAEVKQEPGKLRLAVHPATGAPGDGGTALATAITRLLQRQDLAILSDPSEKADLSLDMSVTVAKPAAGKQHVKIVWHIRRSNGDEIGNVVQENDIPKGSLDGAWADIAFTIAMAAEEGIMQLIARGGPQAANAS